MFFKFGGKGTIYFFIHNGVKIFISPFFNYQVTFNMLYTNQLYKNVKFKFNYL
ncbi:hypothetical protein SAMN05444420_10120 [Capnocytophaga granulosa]|uniref:Uncharacterized protein n=1 Tax=Capnocytophaga granulosa TaxID=45242 RepID=A0A1H2Q4I2_9FLAO|nr:hypothetical protein HMPREF9331_00233 [Capnocytophaga granulosa ATCC 51502]SDW01594.1 hypothetical protein SAMN05444420_10120 [Capnocytophaga granulosa]SUX22723.1 Uncharacterised protein [Capnocytophaga granulosa]